MCNHAILSHIAEPVGRRNFSPQGSFRLCKKLLKTLLLVQHNTNDQGIAALQYIFVYWYCIANTFSKNTYIVLPENSQPILNTFLYFLKKYVLKYL